MKILWLTNIPLPEASKLINGFSLPYGGWLDSASESLSAIKDISLSVAFPMRGDEQIRIIVGEKIEFYAFSPNNNKFKDMLIQERQFEEILNKVEPDIVHIYGTEYPYSLVMIDKCNSKNIRSIISIQGLVSVIAKHYLGSIPPKIQKRFTFRDFVRQDNLEQQRRKFASRGKFEIEAIQKAKNIIGRTTWDRACTLQINTDVHYHFCNETLRNEFYKHVWSLDNCEKHSIFISQGSYPIKGLHFMLEAMPIILHRFPDAKLYIAGPNFVKSDTVEEKLRMSSYGKFIKEIIRKNHLMDKIEFTGLLDEKQMCKKYLSANVFVCPSAIENSPNSLGEAMILGVPCVASDVGGVTDMMKHREDGFVYQVDAPYMLAYYVGEIFDNKKSTRIFGKNAREHALKTHDKEKNLERLLSIYSEVIAQG